MPSDMPAHPPIGVPGRPEYEPGQADPAAPDVQPEMPDTQPFEPDGSPIEAPPGVSGPFPHQHA